MNRHVLVTGGAGYVGSALVPRLLEEGHRVTVLDLYLYGEVLDEHPHLREVRGDIRDERAVEDAMRGCDSVIHLACISNDPSFELDPKLGRSINYDAFRPLVRAAKRAGADRFVYASSSSVYGVKDEPHVTEDATLEPLTDYSRYKAACEDDLHEEREPGFTTLVIRPATVCGYARRLRLDLTVNILTAHAVTHRQITVFGGTQRRPNIHIEDMVDLYLLSLDLPADSVDGRVYNAGAENRTVLEIAETVQRLIGDDVEIVTAPTDDLRSYHISSERIERELGFAPRRTIEDAVRDLAQAFERGLVPDPLGNPAYHNVRLMQEVQLR